jgi:hypothetical protein
MFAALTANNEMGLNYSLSGNAGRAHQVAEHHREIAALPDASASGGTALAAIWAAV